MSNPDNWIIASGVAFFSGVVLIVVLRVYVAHRRIIELAGREGSMRSYLWSLASTSLESPMYMRTIVEVNQPRREKHDSGMDPSEIDALPTFIVNRGSRRLDSKEDAECCVCLEEFQADEKGRTLPTCGHRFHAECVDMWFFTHTTCPLCRKTVGSSLRAKLISKSHDSATDENQPQISDQTLASSSGTCGPSTQSCIDQDFVVNIRDPQSTETGSS